MPIKNGIIEAPIALSDVAQALGESNEDVGRLCTSEKINPWARFKPVKVSPDVPYTPNGYSKGVDGNSGFTFPEYGGTTGTLYRMISLFTEDGKNGWEYNRLKADGSTFLRITDFEFYKHAAGPPFGRLYLSNKIEVESGTKSIFVTPEQRAGWSSLHEVTLKDIERITYSDPVSGDMRPWRFGVFLYGIVSNKEYYRREIGEPLWDDELIAGTAYAASLTLDISDLPIGEYNIYPILANQAISGSEHDVSVSAIPVPYLRYATLKVVASTGGGTQGGFQMYGIATERKALDGIYIDFKFTFTNNESYAKTISNNYIWYYPNNLDVSVGGATFQQWAVDDVTMEANSQKTITISKLANDATSTSQWKYSFGDGDYQQGPMMILQEGGIVGPAPIV